MPKIFRIKLSKIESKEKNSRFCAMYINYLFSTQFYCKKKRIRRYRQEEKIFIEDLRLQSLVKFI